MNVNEQINFQSNMSDEKRPRLKSWMTSSTKPLPRAPADEKKKKKKKKEATTRLFPSEGGGDRKYSKGKSRAPEISYPTQFEHTLHMGYDPVTAEFTGMPEAWAQLLYLSDISRAAEQRKKLRIVLSLCCKVCVGEDRRYPHHQRSSRCRFLRQCHILLGSILSTSI